MWGESSFQGDKGVPKTKEKWTMVVSYKNKASSSGSTPRTVDPSKEVSNPSIQGNAVSNETSLQPKPTTMS